MEGVACPGRPPCSRRASPSAPVSRPPIWRSSEPVADRERQNLELYKTGSEILQRYADFGFGRALAAREPFTGLARARLRSKSRGTPTPPGRANSNPRASDGRPSTRTGAGRQFVHSQREFIHDSNPNHEPNLPLPCLSLSAPSLSSASRHPLPTPSSAHRRSSSQRSPM